MNNTLIIIPTFNEAPNIKQITEEIFHHVKDIKILIIDDNSPDGTGEIVSKISKEDKRVIFFKRAKKLGLGTAYREGFSYAIKDGFKYIITMDADFSHSPEVIPIFLNTIESADLVIGSRYIHGGKTENWGIKRRILSRSGNIFAKILLSLPVQDVTAGFRCIRSSCVEKIGIETLKCEGYAFHIETTYRFFKQGFKIVEIPITFVERKSGKSKISRGIVKEAFNLVTALWLKGHVGKH